MNIGICGGAEVLPYAAKCGFEYIEPAATVMRGRGDKELAAFRRQAEDAGLTVRATNGFFPGDMKLYEAADAELLSYAVRNYETANILGAKIMVVGSGAARSVPAGMERGEAYERLLHIIDVIGKRAEGYGITLAMEPLRYAESNMINTLAECIGFCREVNRKNVLCLLDLFHFYSNGEDLSDLDLLKPGELCHVHVARPDPDRRYPQKTDLPVLKTWAEKLKSIGYSGGVSLECVRGAEFSENATEAGENLRVFK